MGVFDSSSSPAPPPSPPPPLPEHRGDLTAIKALRYGSLAVLCGYGVGIAYKCGVFRKILPAAMNGKVESTIEAIKEKTQPLGDKQRFGLARQHLMKAYGWAASGMVTMAAGVVGFGFFPKIPIAIPLVTTTIPAVLLLAIPKRYFMPAGRIVCYYLSLLSAGYCFGPIGWVAQDSLVVFVLLGGCTMTGLCVPLYLTRGLIMYVASAQLLSLALSVSLVTAPATSNPLSPFKHVKAHAGVQMILNADVNILLTLQLAANLGICLLHTVPTIVRFVTWKDLEEALLDRVDALKEAYCICAGAGYIVFRATRFVIGHIIRKVIADQPSSKGQTSGLSVAVNVNGHSVNVAQASGAVSGLMMFLWYIKAVSHLQRGDPTKTLNHIRDACQRFSPIALLLR